MLAAPASPFVEAFLGRETALRRLGLLSIGELVAGSGSGSGSDDAARGGTTRGGTTRGEAGDHDVPELEADAPARAALDLLLRTPGAMICVRDGDGRSRSVTLDAFRDALR